MAQIVLDYLRVLVTAPVVAAAVLFLFRKHIRKLIDRLGVVKIFGTEFSAPQQLESPPGSSSPLPEVPIGDQPALPASSSPSALQEAFNAERARAYLWEYRFLNLFLAPASQKVLEWFGTLTARATFAWYDSLWTPAIPDPHQRNTILSVLQAHFLVMREGDLYQISPKGREYLEWRTRVGIEPRLGE